MIKTSTRQTQGWQIEAQERKYRHNPISRHQNIINEMDNKPVTWGINMSKKEQR